MLYFGRKYSPEMEFFLEFGEGSTSNAYGIKLKGTDEDDLKVWPETAYYHKRDQYNQPYEKTIALIANESQLKLFNHICARQAMYDLESYHVYHFHDTSDTAAVKATCDVDDNSFLRPQAENLAIL